MTDSRTKEEVILRHLANEMLQAPILSPMRHSSQDLSVDHPTVPPLPDVIERAVRALKEGQTHYVDVPGIGPLRETLAGYLHDMGLACFQQDNVLVTAGMQEARFLSIQIVGDQLSSLALPSVVHPGARKAAGVRRLDIRSMATCEASGFLPRVSEIRKALERGSKLLYLESPVRLTGAAFDVVSVREIAQAIAEFDAAVIWDQGLAPWVADYASLGAEPGMEERVVVLGEAWPGMGLESWLVAYIAAREDWWEEMRKQKQVMSICTNTPSQFAATRAAETYPALHEKQWSELAHYREEALDLARGLLVEPVTGVAVNLLAWRAQYPEQAKGALRDGGFSFADGSDFGAPGVLRLSVTPENTIAEAVKSLQQPTRQGDT